MTPEKPQAQQSSRADDAEDVDVTLLEDSVAGQKVVDIVELFRELVAPLADVFDELVRQILMDATRTEIGECIRAPEARS